MEEEAYKMINFHLNFHYVDSTCEGKGYQRLECQRENEAAGRGCAEWVRRLWPSSLQRILQIACFLRVLIWKRELRQETLHHLQKFCSREEEKRAGMRIQDA